MLLSVFTRHSAGCKFSRDRACRRCNCPKWVGGQINGYYFRQSAKTRQWAEADAVRQQLEEALAKGLPPFGTAVAEAEPTVHDTPAPPVAPSASIETPAVPSHEIRSKPRPRVTVAQAVDAYLADAVSRSVETSTLKKLETIFRKQFLAWTRVQGFEYLDELDLDALLNFRNTWEDGPLAKQKKQSRVIGFFWACVRRRYLTENPAIGLGKIKVVQVPTDYFPPEEFERIMAATYIRRGERGGGDVKANQARLRTMTLLMRWSGLRIRDAVTLERHRLHGDSLLLYQAKTGTPVYVPLPPHVVELLEDVPPGPKPNPRYFFWSGNGDPKSAVADWQRSYRRLFESADITTADGERKRCHPHMFRDTFAVEMLLAGVPIDQVSLLLGHASVKITEKSYAPFVKARQVQLQESVRNAWKAGSGNGPQSTPPSSPSVNKRAGWQVIHTGKSAKATA
ncbi:MAG: tyrosine-type recombinase/integrase [Acidobacteriota bacterium]